MKKIQDIKRYSPVTPSRRKLATSTFMLCEREKELSDHLPDRLKNRLLRTSRASSPEKSLLLPKKRISGRNHQGRITCRHRGGGHKRHYRIIDFIRDKIGIESQVQSIEYDPNRSALIALLFYRDGEKRYILAPKGVGLGDTLSSGSEAPIRPGNALPLHAIPLGSLVHNIEMRPGKGGASKKRRCGRSAHGKARWICDP